MKRFGILIFFFALITAVSSCTCEQKLAAVVNKCPGLVKRDTVFRTDTFRVPEVKIDTAFVNQVTRDTIIIRKDHLTIKYFNSRDSIFITGKCDSIIKFVNVPVQVNSIETKPLSAWQQFWFGFKDYLIAALLGCILILLVLQKKTYSKG